MNNLKKLIDESHSLKRWYKLPLLINPMQNYKCIFLFHIFLVFSVAYIIVYNTYNIQIYVYQNFVTSKAFSQQVINS